MVDLALANKFYISHYNAIDVVCAEASYASANVRRS